MLKALLRKQASETLALYFPVSKKGKIRSKKTTVLLIILFVFLYLAIGASMYMLSTLFAENLIPMGFGWMYFALMLSIAVVLGVFGSIFTTYTGIFHAHDNELLLSMPIPPSVILFTRAVSVYLSGLAFSSMVSVPVVIAYFVYAKPTPLAVVNCILTPFLLGFLILALSCLLGWLVALIAARLRNKSFVTVALAIVFLGGYYYFYFKMQTSVGKLFENVVLVGTAVKNAAYPLYLLGRGAEGDMVGMAITAGWIFALTGVVYLLLSKSFLKIALSPTAVSKKEYTDKAIKTQSVESALLKKEFGRFGASSTYMLNSALGTVLMPVLGVCALVFADKLVPFLSLLPIGRDLVCVILEAMACMVAGMNVITAPSVSLEGKNLWILRSLPVEPRLILDAKKKMHCIVSVPPAVIMTVCVAIAVDAGGLLTILMTAVSAAFVLLSAECGLILNLQKPDFDWTNETAPVKQGFAPTVCIFGGWAVAIAIGGVGYLTRNLLPAAAYLGVVLLLLAAADFAAERYLRHNGEEILTRL